MIEPTEDRRLGWRDALGLTLLLRLIYSLLAAVSALMQPMNWQLIRSNALTENLPPTDHTWHYLLFGVWQRFDTLWYLHIAAHGYDRPDAVVFFPLYPILIRVVSVIVSPVVAALLISTAAAFFLFWGLLDLLYRDHPPTLVNRSVVLCAVWPAAFIFFAGYPESLLYALIVWSLCMARRERWVAAAAFGIAAAMTKAVGGVIVIPLLIMACRRRTVKAVAVVLVPLGSLGFMEYLHWMGRGNLFSAYSEYWRTSAAAPWTTLWASVESLIQAPNPILVMNLVSLIAVCIFVVGSAVQSRIRMEYVIFSAGTILVLLCKETIPPLQSMIRYLLIVFPAFVGLAGRLQGPHSRARFGMVCAGLFLVNVGLLWLFEGWSLVL